MKKNNTEKQKKFKEGKSIFERTWLGQIFGALFGIGKQY